jgi:SH3-like domain-containing protein
VTIPNVGLRRNHSLESKTVPRAAIRNGERVEIINRFSNGGPGWLQVRTKVGKVGWVFASVVKEQKAKDM